MLWHTPVVVKDLEAVDIQHADDGVLPVQHRVVVFHFYDAVDAADDPAEEPLVESLQQGGRDQSKVTSVEMR